MFSSGDRESGPLSLFKIPLKIWKFKDRNQKKQMISNKLKLKESQMHGKRKNFPMFLGKMIKHKMFDKEEVIDIWYRGIVTQLLGDNETNDDCDFTVKYKGFDDIYEVR